MARMGKRASSHAKQGKVEIFATYLQWFVRWVTRSPVAGGVDVVTSHQHQTIDTCQVGWSIGNDSVGSCACDVQLFGDLGVEDGVETVSVDRNARHVPSRCSVSHETPHVNRADGITVCESSPGA